MILAFFWACARDPDAPPDLSYDHVACAECGMLVSDPAYASALTLEDGNVVAFDDPGCLFKYVMEQHPKLHAMWFHSAELDRWLREDEARFTTGNVSPMGSGLAPTDAATPGALTVGAASALVMSR